jgi:hypothetical protein
MSMVSPLFVARIQIVFPSIAVLEFTKKYNFEKGWILMKMINSFGKKQ